MDLRTKLPDAQQTVLLTTFRRDGTPVGTPVSVAVEGNRAYFRTWESAGKLKRIPFKDRAPMKKLVDPVMEAYAKEIGAGAIFAKIVALN